MTTPNFQWSNLLLSKVIRVQSEQDDQVNKDMKGTSAMIATTIWPWKYWSRKTAKNPTCNAFYASKLQEYVEEGLLFQNIPKYKNYPCRPRSPIFSHNTKLSFATFCWFCDAGSHMELKNNSWCRNKRIILQLWKIHRKWQFITINVSVKMNFW